MPNAIPSRLTSLTFASTDLQRADLSVHCEVVSGLNDGLDVRGSDTIVPSAEGRIARDRKGDVRHIVVACTIQGVGVSESLRLADAQALRDELETLFDPRSAPDTLAGVAADGSARAIECRPQPGIVWSELLPGVETASVLFDSVDPDWQVTEGGS